MVCIQGILVGLQFTTIISVSAVIACTQGVFLFALWLMDRRVVTLMWWAVAFGAMAAGGSLAIWRTFDGPWLAGASGGALAIFAFGLVWQATRAFEGRSSVWAAAAGVALLWFGGAVIVGSDADAQVLMASVVTLFAFFLLLALREIWRGRSEALPSRKPLAIALGVATLCIFLEIFFGLGSGAGAAADASLPLGVWLTLAATIAVSTGAALALGMTRERQQRARDVLSALDPQTGALNLGAFLGQAARLVSAQLKVRAPVTFVAVQLEAAGEGGGVEGRVRAVHDRLIALSRVTDIVARIRPGAFAVLMPNIEPDEALPLIQRVLRESANAGGHMAAARWDALRARVSIVSSTEVGHDLRAMILAAEGTMEETRFGTSDAYAIYRASRQEPGRRTIMDSAGLPVLPGVPRELDAWPAKLVLD